MKFNPKPLLPLLISVMMLMSSCTYDLSPLRHESPDKIKKITHLEPQSVEDVVDAERTYALSDQAYTLIELGLIEEDRYSLEDVATRDMAVQVILDFIGRRDEAKMGTYTHPYIDVSEELDAYVGYLYQHQLIDGISDNKFGEDKLIDSRTFLTYILRILGYSDDRYGDFTYETVLDFATKLGLISLRYQSVLDSEIFLIDDMLYIMSTALTQPKKDETTRYIDHLIEEGVVNEETLQELWQDTYLMEPLIEPFFVETFDDKTLNNHIYDQRKRIIWRGSDTRYSNNEITENGYLSLSGEGELLQDMQTLYLEKEHLEGRQNYGMSFTVNVNRMGNEGDKERSIFTIIPRSKDEEMTQYYAINYYLDGKLGDYVSNLASCRWTIFNTNDPMRSKPVAEGRFFLKEDTDYTARVSIENTEDSVDIKIYMDGPDKERDNYEPVVSYTDATEHRITESATGPAIGLSGYLDDVWGFPAKVLFDDVRLYDIKDFKAITQQIRERTQLNITLEKDDILYDHIHYLTRLGALKPYKNMTVYSEESVSINEFLISLLQLKGQWRGEESITAWFDQAIKSRYIEGLSADSLDHPINRYEASIILSKMARGFEPISRYGKIIADEIPEIYEDAVNFAIQNSYLKLNDSNQFMGDTIITRNDLIEIMACWVDPSYRINNYKLVLPYILSDNAILQRNKPVPISGRGMSGDTVTVSFNGQVKTTIVVDGHWAVELDSMPHGGPYTLTVSDSARTLKARNIYVGEVFIVAGQSNAAMTVYECNEQQKVIDRFIGTNKMRIFFPDKSRSSRKRFDSYGSWRTTEYDWIVGQTTAIGVFFVDKIIDLNQELNGVKIGIIQITYGGTSIELFMPDSASVKHGFEQKDDEFIMSGFWNGFMDSMTPYAARGYLYYQGENSTHLHYAYEPLLRSYIDAVRKEFYDPNLPILLVQISSYGLNYSDEVSTWATIREIQMRVSNTVDHVGLMTAIDLADEDPLEIHPKDKRPIGERLAHVAMHEIYGKEVLMKSPVMTDYTLEEGVYTITFDDNDLTIREGDDKGFEVLDENGQWVKADAKLCEGGIQVWSNYVKRPKGVRYAWFNYPVISLFNKDDLPVLPFNTTKNLFVEPKYDRTNETTIKKAYHLLGSDDAIINKSRGYTFSFVKPINPYILQCERVIDGQDSGDVIIKLSRDEDRLVEQGTTSTEIIVSNHMITPGDWIKNVKYGEYREVIEVIDEDTIRVDKIIGQCESNVIEIYHNRGEVIAE